jgi:hypothetical protein
MGKNHQWADAELTAFYQHYHNTTKDWTQVSSSALLPFIAQTLS